MTKSVGYNQITFVLLSVLMVGLPFSKAAVSTAMVLLVIASLLTWKPKKDLITKYSPILIFSVLFFLHIPGLIASENLSEAMSFLNKQIGYLLIPFVLLTNMEVIKAKGIRLIHFFVISCSITSMFTILLLILPEDLTISISETLPMVEAYEKTVNRVSFGIYSPFIDRLHFSYLLVLSLILGAWDLVRNERKISLYLYLPILINFVLLGGRGAQLAAVFILVLWLIFLYIYKSNKKINYLAITGIVIGGLIVLPYLSYQVIPPVKKRYDQLFWELKLVKSGEYKSWNYEHFTSLRRLLSIKHHAKLIKKSPWLGVGIGDYRDELRRAYNEDAAEGLNLSPNANNQYLFYWANSGILALILFFFVVYYWTKSSLRNHQHLVDKILIMSFAFFFLFILVFDVFIVYQIGIISFSIFGGLIYTLTQSNSDNYA